MVFRPLLIAIVAFIISWASIRILSRLFWKFQILDVPNARSMHTEVTPRGGGVGIVIGIIAGLLIARYLGYSGVYGKYLFAVGLIALIGLIEDWVGLSIVTRLIAQSSAALIVILSFGGIPSFPLGTFLELKLGVFELPLTLIWIVGLTNIYNFLDGIDGYAAAQAVVGGLAIGIWHSMLHPYGFGISIAAAAAGFLFWNWRPARVFMGDSGSTTIGFLFATLPMLQSSGARDESTFVVIASLWFFISDGIFTMMRRFVRGEKIWTPHRTHLYQRLVTSGIDPRFLVKVVMFFSMVLGGLAIWAVESRSPFLQCLTIALSLLFFFAYWKWTVLREHSKPVDLAQKQAAERF